LPAESAYDPGGTEVKTRFVCSTPISSGAVLLRSCYRLDQLGDYGPTETISPSLPTIENIGIMVVVIDHGTRKLLEAKPHECAYNILLLGRNSGKGAAQFQQLRATWS